MRTPSRRNNNPKAKFMVEMADKVCETPTIFVVTTGVHGFYALVLRNLHILKGDE